MAEKLERIYTVRLSGAYNYPRITRARRAVGLLRKFIARHMKAAEVSISNLLNSEVWRNGIEKPPRTVKIKAVKEGDAAKAYLFGEEEATAARQKKKEEKRKAAMDRRKGRAKKAKPGTATAGKASAQKEAPKAPAMQGKPAEKGNAQSKQQAQKTQGSPSVSPASPPQEAKKAQQ